MDMHVIKEVYKKKPEEQELFRKKAVNDAFSALEKLGQEVSFKEAYLFGSVTKPRHFHEDSDIDIAFRGLDRDRLFYTVAFLSGVLQRDVNAVHLEDIHFGKKVISEGMKWKKG